MKLKIFSPFACVVGIVALLLTQGCNKEDGTEPGFGTFGSGLPVKQIDIDVCVPIHPSSLEYFDYSISLADNSGEEYRDTVRKSDGRISPENVFWVEYFRYKSLPVICRCEVELIPKVTMDSEVSFSYIEPKPFIYSRVIFNAHSSSSYSPTEKPDLEDREVQKIDCMRLGSFLSEYGRIFSSTCTVRQDYDSIDCSFE